MELQAIGSGMGRRRIPPVPRTAGVSWICKHLSTLQSPSGKTLQCDEAKCKRNQPHGAKQNHNTCCPPGESLEILFPPWHTRQHLLGARHAPIHGCHPHLVTEQDPIRSSQNKFPPMYSTCLLFSQRINSIRLTRKCRKENSQAKQKNNSLAIKQSQGPLVPPQGLQIIF